MGEGKQSSVECRGPREECLPSEKQNRHPGSATWKKLVKTKTKVHPVDLATDRLLGTLIRVPWRDRVAA